MNKQEAIEKIKNLYNFVMEDGPFEVDLINKSQAIDIISKIDEPQKPVVPKFVAEWIEAHKGDCNCGCGEEMYDLITNNNLAYQPLPRRIIKQVRPDLLKDWRI